MVKDHSDSERENSLPSHRLLFPISSKGSLYASSNRQDNIYHGLCYTSRGALAGTRVVVNQFAQFPILRYKIFHPNEHRLYVLNRRAVISLTNLWMDVVLSIRNPNNE